MEEWNGVISKRSSFGGRSMRDIDQDFEEEEIWESVKENDNITHQDYYSTTPKVRKKPVSSSFSTNSSTLPRMIPRRANSNTCKTTGNEDKVVAVQQSSAPMEIPDWSKIYGKKGTKNGYHHHDHADSDGGDDDNDDDGDEMVPPHEWIARKLARSQISSFSVCEGIGRTLKGRDLSKVRNAVLTKTGFLE